MKFRKLGRCLGSGLHCAEKLNEELHLETILYEPEVNRYSIWIMKLEKL